MISEVINNRNAQLHGLTRGDVVIAYNGRPIPNHEQLQIVPADPIRPRVGLKYWRGGVVHEVEVASGPLGVILDKRSPRVFHAALAEALRIQLRSGLRPLPAARWEAELIAREFGRDRSRVLLGAEAKESAIQAAATSGELASYRILHFAVHGAAEERRAFGTSIYLAPDGAGVEIESDGVISAEQVARTWNLDADLVVLSACEASNGLELEGQGLLGFVQPLLAKGARTVVASNCRVDDTASALLMMLFYDHLLGKGLTAGKALPSAEALQAAKDRLRGATLKEIRAMIAARGLDAKIEVRADGPKDSRPFASPRYWAAFQVYGALGEKAGGPIVGRVE